ncbi:MAG: DUF2141 domain-containing protein [Alphaproteobacteria bacterium]|nr:MAG: DUF2141 domain-containing protein [Alphaproteobacteria bacterium]
MRVKKTFMRACAAVGAAVVAAPAAAASLDYTVREDMRDVAAVDPAVPEDPFHARCDGDADGPALRVTVRGILMDEGNVRVQLYNHVPEEFLAKGKSLMRVTTPVRGADTPVVVCLPLKGPGTYAILAYHDRDADNKADALKEGFAISNNPRLKLRKPRHDEAAFEAGEGVTDVDITLQYLLQRSSRNKSRR